MMPLTGDQFKEIINKQMDINGYPERFEDLQKIDSWYEKFTCTQETEQEFKDYLYEYLKKKCSKKRLIGAIDWFILAYGLKVSDYD